MDFIVQNGLLILVALSSGAMLLWPSLLRGGGARSVSPTEAVQLMNRQKAVVVDVCSADEFAAGHVAQAKHVPLAELEERLPQVVKNKTVPLVLVCASGLRSKRAVATAKKLGYEQTFSMTGGLGAWRAANLPVQKG